MTDKRLPAILSPGDGSPYRLRLCDARDLDRLRAWKNANRAFFFHKAEISEAQQRAWFAAYAAREDDHMYMIEEAEGADWVSVGVAGVRYLREEKVLDAYNIMRGERTVANRTNMGRCFRVLCDTASEAYGMPVSCKVLVTNPALEWYKHLGFRCAETTPEYELLVDGARTE